MTKDQARRIGELLMRIRPAPLAAVLKVFLRIRRMLVTTADGEFWIDPGSYQGVELLKHGIYETELLATLKSYLGPGDTFVDVGANEGYFSVVAARLVGPSGRVLAVEPQSRLRAVIEKNLALNRCINVSLVTNAVSDKQCMAKLHLTTSLNNSASSLTRPTKYPLFRQSVYTSTLKEILDGACVEQCALMKIDIEGSEYEAVLGSREIFTSGQVRALALELHPRQLAARGLDAGDIMQFLHASGYREVTGTGHLFLVHGR